MKNRADVFSRRMSIIIGVFLTGLGFILGGASYLALGIFLLIFMPEHNFQRTCLKMRHLRAIVAAWR